MEALKKVFRKKVTNLNAPRKAHIAKTTVKPIVFKAFSSNQGASKSSKNDTQKDGLNLPGTAWNPKTAKIDEKKEIQKKS